MNDDVPINTSSVDYLVDERLRNKMPPRENYVKNFQKHKVVTDHVPLPDTEATENRSWTLNEIERVVASETLAPSKLKLDQFGLNENRKNDFRLRSLSRRLNYQLQRQFRRELNEGPTEKRLKNFDLQSQSLRMIQANAALGTYQFQRTQTLPFMRKTLALDYQKITLLKKVVGGIASMEKAIVSKLEAIKMNTAAVLPQKEGLLTRLRKAIAQKNIDHVASNISNFQIEGWHNSYERYVSPRLAKLHEKIKTPGKYTGVNAIPNYVSRKLNSLRHLTAKLGEETPLPGSALGEVRQKASQAATKLLDGATKYSQKLRFSENLNNRLGKMATFVTDPLSRIKPFAPIIPTVKLASDGSSDVLEDQTHSATSLTETLLSDVRKGRLETNKHYKLLREDVHAIRQMMQDYQLPSDPLESVEHRAVEIAAPRRRSVSKTKTSRLLEEMHPISQASSDVMMIEGSTTTKSRPRSKSPVNTYQKSIIKPRSKPTKSKITNIDTTSNDKILNEVSKPVKTILEESPTDQSSSKKGRIGTTLSRSRKPKLKTVITPKQQSPIDIVDYSTSPVKTVSEVSSLQNEIHELNERRKNSLVRKLKETTKAKLNKLKENQHYKDLTDKLMKGASLAAASLRPGSYEERRQQKKLQESQQHEEEKDKSQDKNKKEDKPQPASDLNLTAGISAALGAAGGYVLRKTGGLALNTTKGLLYRGGTGVGATIGRTVNKGAIGAVKGTARLGLNAAKGLVGLEAKGVGGLLGQVGNAGIRGATSLAGKTVSGALGLLGRGGLGILKSGFGLGLGLGVAQFAYNKLGVKNKALNRTVNTGFSAAQGALLGASIGSFFGGIGAVPGAAIGGLAGAALENSDYISKGINKAYSSSSKFIADLITGNKKPDNQLNRNPFDPSKPYNPLDFNQARERYYQDNPDKRPPGYRPPQLSQTPIRSPDNYTSNTASPSVTSYDSQTGKFSTLNYGTPAPEQASRKKAQLTKGGIKDQPEFKAALSKLPKNIQVRVMKSNALQFTLWATSIQHGPDMASKIFQRDYSDTLDDKAFVRSIYQDRAQQFSNLNYNDKMDANEQLIKEQNIIDSFDRGYKANRQDIVSLFSNVVDTNSVNTGGINPNYKPQIIKGPKNDLIKRAMSFFKGLNYSTPAAAGIVANLLAESGLQPHGKPGDGGKSIGIAQWHPNRRRDIFNKFGKSVENMSFEEQLQAVDWEIRSGKNVKGGTRLFEKLKQVQDAQQAAIMVMEDYERPAEANRVRDTAVRTRNAVDILKTVSGGNMASPSDVKPQPSPTSKTASDNQTKLTTPSPSITSSKPSQTPSTTTKQTARQSQQSQNHDQLINAFAAHAKAMQSHAEALKAPSMLQKPESKPSVVVSPSIFTNNQKATTLAMSMKKSQVAVGEY